MRGSIISSGFASGDRVVIGHWAESPIGPVTDVMWAAPDGTRTLFVPDDRAAAFVSGVYEFDAVEVVAFRVYRRPREIDVELGDRFVHAVAGRGIPIPIPRPAAITRWVERPIARALMGVVTYGVSPTGVREWYRADRWAPLRDARAIVAGRDLGAMAPIDPRCGFGFSEPPPRPSWVDVRPLLEYPETTGAGAQAPAPDSRSTGG